MILLELEHVSKRSRRGVRDALDDVSLSIDQGELVTVWGERRSGRSTLLRVLAGIETPDAGVVRFAGRDLADRSNDELGEGIGYCRTAFRASAGQHIVDLLAATQLARGRPRSAARSRAWEVLERVAAKECAKRTAEELGGEELVRIAIARALACEPRLLVIDEPTIGVELVARDGILSLLRSIADDGIAVLTSTGEGTGFLGADRVLALHKGKLRGEIAPELAPVTELERHREARGSA
ncbi:MAG: ATP-binding cassette domain-containing protein [Solirubrobacteraceae bacterium]